MTTFDFNEYQRAFRFGEYRTRVMPRLVCADGVSLSVQASEAHYCEPRYSDMYEYDSVEVGYPSVEIGELLPYAEDIGQPTSTVYGRVPVELVNAIVNAHGGLQSTPTEGGA